MSDARLTTGLWVSALLRRLQGDGVFVQILASGDMTAGAVIVSSRSKNGAIRTLERSYTRSGGPAWIETSATLLTDSEALAAMIRARSRDPDLWWIEAEVDDLSPYLDGPIIEPNNS
jgi:hypothetical protein